MFVIQQKLLWLFVTQQYYLKVNIIVQTILTTSSIHQNRNIYQQRNILKIKKNFTCCNQIYNTYKYYTYVYMPRCSEGQMMSSLRLQRNRKYRVSYLYCKINALSGKLRFEGLHTIVCNNVYIVKKGWNVTVGDSYVSRSLLQYFFSS